MSQPTVSSEVPSTATSVPFLKLGVFPDYPIPAGYTEKEYFFSGKASIYEFTPTGTRIVSPCPASVTGTEMASCKALPYTTRMLVLEPIKPSHFSGNVWVNPLNPSANYDYQVELDRSLHYHAGEGDIYVMWTSKGVAVNTLKEFDSQRYASLNWPYEPAQPGGNNAPYDGITYDVAAQVGALLHENGPNSPIHDYKVKRIFETGFSQDGGFVFNQANIFHNLERMPGGGRIYDGYLPQGFAGTGVRVSDINFGLTPHGALPAGDPRIKMGHRDAPVIKLNTETEIAGLYLSTLRPPLPINWRRPDSNAPNDRYREWEVPGASHDDAQTLLDPSNIYLFGAPEFPNECEHADPPNVSPTDFRFDYVVNAASEALVKWVSEGKKPPRSPSPVKQTNLAVPVKETILRDQYGNALGGVRTPQLEVPASTYNVQDTGPAFCFTNGWSEPLSQATLNSLYPTHSAYVRAFTRSANETVRAGFWLEEDAARAIREAKEADVP